MVINYRGMLDSSKLKGYDEIVGDVIMLTRERRDEIEKIIGDILLSSGISFPKNTVAELLQKQNILFNAYADLPEGCSGIIFFRNSVPFIATNKLDSDSRRTFSLAHEFGHFILHPLVNGEEYRLDYYKYPNDQNVLKKENEANYFATSLLVPKRKLLEVLEISDNIELIAEYFGVSEQVIENRLKWI